MRFGRRGRGVSQLRVVPCLKGAGTRRKGKITRVFVTGATGAPHGDRNSTGSTAASACSSPRNGNGSETGPEPIGTTISIRRGES